MEVSYPVWEELAELERCATREVIGVEEELGVVTQGLDAKTVADIKEAEARLPVMVRAVREVRQETGLLAYR